MTSKPTSGGTRRPRDGGDGAPRGAGPRRAARKEVVNSAEPILLQGLNEPGPGPGSEPGSAGRNRTAVEATIVALTELGRVEPVDAAVVAAARALADAVDAAPDHASLWLQYQRALETLRSLGATETDNSFDRLLEQLRAPVGDVENTKPRNTRRSGGSGR